MRTCNEIVTKVCNTDASQCGLCNEIVTKVCNTDASQCGLCNEIVTKVCNTDAAQCGLCNEIVTKVCNIDASQCGLCNGIVTKVCNTDASQCGLCNEIVTKVCNTDASQWGRASRGEGCSRQPGPGQLSLPWGRIRGWGWTHVNGGAKPVVRDKCEVETMVPCSAHMCMFQSLFMRFGLGSQIRSCFASEGWGRK
jgi:hypothetical protein